MTATALALRDTKQVQPWNGSSFAVVYREMEQAIDQCDSISAAMEIEENARFWEGCAKAAQERSPEIACARIRRRALRRLGEILAKTAADGTRRGRGGDQKSKFRPQTLKLEDLGITKRESFVAQRLAKIPADTFEELLAANMDADAMIRHHFSENPDDADEHWISAGMPKFEQPSAKYYKSLTLNIETREAMEDLSRLLGQTITEKTRYINFKGMRR